jgi:hypothetical protein
MQPLLFMIDTAFANEFFRIFGSTTATFDQECRVVTQPDSMLGTTVQTSWEDCIDQVLYELAQNPTDLAIILGHKGIFDSCLPTLDRYKAEARVSAAEKDLLDRLDPPKPVVYVRGFHHLPDSAIYRLLADPSSIAAPGTYTKLRLIVEEGGGPLGRLSVLKHNLMTPFGSVRLHLQLEAEDGAQTMSHALVERIVGAVQRGRSDLTAINTCAEENQSFHDAVIAARSLLARDVREIAADMATFQRWIDQLNEALDQVREEAR